MQIRDLLLVAVSVCFFVLPAPAQNRKYSATPTKLLSAKSAYFEDRSDSAAVGQKALAQLKKWGRFQITQDRAQADLIILLSADPNAGKNIVFSGGETGTIDQSGNVHEDSVPVYGSPAPVRYAYLTVMDSKTGESLWSKSHRWGGLLTGFNSAGERLIKELEKQVR